MLARHEQVRRPHLGVCRDDGRQVELQGELWQGVQKIRVGGGDARGVEERGDGADGDGGGCGVCGVAGVVLRAAAYGYVLYYEACCWRG